MDQISNVPSSQDSTLDRARKKPPSTLRRVGAYALVRLLTIGLTIVVGVFLSVVIANKGGGIDQSKSEALRDEARRQLWNMREDMTYEERQEELNRIHARLEDEAGLNDPFFMKHYRWTIDALKLDLGQAIYSPMRARTWIQQEQEEIKNIILTHLPNTLALVGLADFFVFVVGIPLSLYLSRNYGNWIDKIVNILSPLSSVPSWVHGVLLILVFAVTLKALPPGGMIDIPIPETRQAILLSRLKHMLLPALAIFLSLLFQLVYAWRNYFMIYSNEDYVEFAVAKGLSGSEIQNKYILRPSLPYVLTSFALTLVSFWQMATALEIVFNWDGIGRLYILSLPHFWGESMFPGEMGLTIGIVVIFAYLLGVVVFLMDIAYAVVDPRIRLGGKQQRIKPTRIRRRFNLREWAGALPFISGNNQPSESPSRGKAVQAAAKDATRTSRLILIILLFLIIGLLIGLAFGWWVWPVELTNASPADLHSSYQMDYIRLVIDSFNFNQNSDLAHKRLDAMKGDAALHLDKYIRSIGGDSQAKDALVSFASNYNSEAANLSSSQEDLEAQPDGDTSIQNNKIMIVAALFSAAIIIFFVAENLLKKRRFTPRRDKTPKISELESQVFKTPFQRSLSRLGNIFRELLRFPSAVIGMVILLVMITGSLYAVIRYPYQEIGLKWFQEASENSRYVPVTAYPKWINWFRKNDFPETIIVNSKENPEIKSVEVLENGNPDYTFTIEFDYPYGGFPTEGTLYFESQYETKDPFATFTWITPDGREYHLSNAAIDKSSSAPYYIDKNVDRRQFGDHQIAYKHREFDIEGTPVFYGLFADPDKEQPVAVPGTYTLEIKVLAFEPDTQVDVEMVLMGEVYGFAGTDFMRRDLLVPLLWGMPFALVIGLFGALLTTIVSMLFAAFGVWFGGWADSFVQRVTEANMIMPVVAIAVLFYAFYGASLWTILTVIVILNAFGSPTKTFRAAFIQVKEASYIEAAQAYGAPNRRIIFRYMIPRILPVLIPQLVTLVPGFIFLEATLGMFNVKSILPTWGKVIYEALSRGAAWGSKFWVLEPIALLLLTGFAFSLMGFALDRVLNPRLQQGD